MTETMKEFLRKSIDELEKQFPPEELRKQLSVEERLKALSTEERIKGLPVEDLVRCLPRETLEVLTYWITRSRSSAPTQRPLWESTKKLRDFHLESMATMFKELPLEERLKGLTLEERLKGLSAEEIAKTLSHETLEALVR